jgi:hypothetical protein
MNFCLQKKVLQALEDAGVFTSGGLVKDKVKENVHIEFIDLESILNLILMIVDLLDMHRVLCMDAYAHTMYLGIYAHKQSVYHDNKNRPSAFCKEVGHTSRI